jgi:NAD-dependent SIR2 family protein deacetylase
MATDSTREAFLRDPRVVWEYYTQFQKKIITAVPNKGHTALA